MKRAAIAALLGGILMSAGAAAPAASAPLMPVPPSAQAASEGKLHLTSHRAAHRAKGKRIRKHRAKRYSYPRRYHSWSKWDHRKKLHSRKYVGERYHRRCGDWHRCHYYFYGYLQWEKWNPGGSRKRFLKRYHHI